MLQASIFPSLQIAFTTVKLSPSNTKSSLENKYASCAAKSTALAFPNRGGPGGNLFVQTSVIVGVTKVEELGHDF